MFLEIIEDKKKGKVPISLQYSKCVKICATDNVCKLLTGTVYVYSIENYVHTTISQSTEVRLLERYLRVYDLFQIGLHIGQGFS